MLSFELLRWGCDVAIGKIDNREVDFIATKVDVKIHPIVRISGCSGNSKNGGHREFSLSPSEYPWEMENRVVLR